jgi:branched-chain amino acid aminotransferase
MDRLYNSAKVLAIKMEVPQSALSQAVLDLCRANDHQSGYIRLTVSRGTGLGLDPGHLSGPPNVYIFNEQMALYPEELYENGLTMMTSSMRLPAPQIIDPRVKCTGKYINSVLAKIEANLYGVGEAVMLNQQDQVAECTGENIFVVKSGVIHTPPPYACGLQGVTRDAVIQLARENGIPVDETMMTVYDIYVADECFLTGTAAEVVPAVTLNGRTIGSGKAGTITKKIIGLFRDYARSTGTAF